MNSSCHIRIYFLLPNLWSYKASIYISAAKYKVKEAFKICENLTWDDYRTGECVKMQSSLSHQHPNLSPTAAAAARLQRSGLGQHHGQRQFLRRSMRCQRRLCAPRWGSVPMDLLKCLWWKTARSNSHKRPVTAPTSKFMHEALENFLIIGLVSFRATSVASTGRNQCVFMNMKGREKISSLYVNGLESA